MSATSVATLSFDAIPVPPPLIIGAKPVDLQTMPIQRVSDTLASSSAVDLFRISLQKGEFLALDVDPSSHSFHGLNASKLSILNSSGTAIASAGPSLEPDTGILTNNAALGFRAIATGTYYVKVSTTPGNSGDYDLNLQRVGLATGMQTGSQLQTNGSMCAWLNGDTLDFAGPTGYGFGLRGTWTENTTVVNGNRAFTSAAYTATGAIFLETAFGEVPLEVPKGQVIAVATKPNTWKGAVGEVSGMTISLGVPLQNFGADLRQKLGLTMDSISLGDKWTIQLGSQVKAQRGIDQALNAVPYLVYGDKGAFRVQFGGITITNAAAAGTVFLADPADPMLYIRTSRFSFAGSLQGHIAYTPKFTPTAPMDALFGNVYASGNFDISGKLKLGFLPLKAEGDITLNLDANHDGLWLAGKENASQLFQNNSLNGDAFAKVFADLDLGLNGEIDAGYNFAGYNFTAALGAASAVYQGPLGHAWFKGGSVDPWAGTPLDSFNNISTVTFEGSIYAKLPPANVVSGSSQNLTGPLASPYYVIAKSTYNLFLLKTDVTMTLDNTGITAVAQARLLGSNVTFTGQIFANGNFSFAVSESVNIGPFHATANYYMTKTGSTFALGANLTGSATWSGTVLGTKVSTSASITASLTISISSNGSISFAGSAKASGKISGIPYSLSVQVKDNKIVFPIPLIGNQTISLPTL